MWCARPGRADPTVLVLVSGQRFEQLRSQGLPAGIVGTLLVVVGRGEAGDQVVVGEDTVIGGAQLAALLVAATGRCTGRASRCGCSLTGAC